MRIIRNAEIQWKDSTSTQNWQYFCLAPDQWPKQVFPGPYSIRIKCGPEVSYESHLSDDVIDYFILDGSLEINGELLHKGDHLCTDPEVEIKLSTSPNRGMDAICFVRGRVVYGERVFSDIKDGSLSDIDAKRLTALPWIDYLRSYAKNKTGITDMFVPVLENVSTTPAVKELIIDIARYLDAPTLNNAIHNELMKECNLTLRVAAVLFLASKGRMDDNNWKIQLDIMRKNKNELIDSAKAFYASKSDAAFKKAIQKRIEGGQHNYNMPFYQLLLELANEV